MNQTAMIEGEARDQGGSMLDVAASRSAQEIQAAVLLAKKFPRDQNAAFQRIVNGCKRKRLAEQAVYAYPRGGQMVTGPSIRLAEELARGWGNMDFGVVEVEQKVGESICMAYAWDLETNTKKTMVFTVSHYRHTKKGRYLLSDPRDIYEMVANYGARRMRACILAIIPGDIQDEAIEECQRTLAGNNKEPLADRVRKMVTKFSELGVTQSMIEERLGHSLQSVMEVELINLRQVYQSLKDGMASVEDFFTRPEANGGSKSPQKQKGKAKSPTDALAESLGEESQDDETAGEESQETPETEESQEGPIGDEAMGFISRLGEAKTKKDAQAIWGEVQQLKVAGQFSDRDFAEVKAEYEACNKSLKK